MFPIASRCAASTRSMLCCATTLCIAWLYWLMLFPTQKNAIAVCSGVRTVLLSAPYASVSFRSLAYWSAVERRRRLGPELRGPVEQERAHRCEPRRLHGLTRLQLPLPGQDRPDPSVARRRRLETVAGAEGDDVLRRRLTDRDPVGDVAGERCDVRGVLGIDGRLLVGQVVVESRPRGCRNRRLHRGAGHDREREVVVGRVAAFELRHGVVHRRLHVRHVDHAVGLELRRRRGANGVHRVRVPGQHRVGRHHDGLVLLRRGHRQRRRRTHDEEARKNEQGLERNRPSLHVSSSIEIRVREERPSP